jgi:hypothetical protein
LFNSPAVSEMQCLYAAFQYKAAVFLWYKIPRQEVLYAVVSRQDVH